MWCTVPFLPQLRRAVQEWPVVLLPSHRSYLDFILVTYLMFEFNITLPCIAAGQGGWGSAKSGWSYGVKWVWPQCKVGGVTVLFLPPLPDFMHMSVVSSFLRRSGGFFLRRTFGSDRLYKVIFSLYVQVLLSNGDAPMEFFVEGTRSRTAKSLHPKLGTVTDFSTCSHNPSLQHLLLLLLPPPLPPPSSSLPGLLSMVVEPYLMGCLPDILLLPVSISYERTVEEQLFARELLGIPKPKESTRVHCLVSFSLLLLSSSSSHLSSLLLPSFSILLCLLQF